jgi:hypothetical protein
MMARTMVASSSSSSRSWTKLLSILILSSGRLQVTERGVAGAEVVDGNQRPGAAQAQQVLGGGADVFHQAGFGDFQLQAARWQAVGLQQVVDHPRQLAWCSCTVDRLTAMRRSLKPWSCHSRSCRQAWSSTHSPMLMMLPFCSASGMNRSAAPCPAPGAASAAGLDADHAVIAVADLRLVDQVQLVARQGVAQVFFQFAAAAHLAVDAGDVELVAVARAGLGQGHGLFGFLQQLLGAVAVFGEQGDADGGAQADLLVIEVERRFQVVEDALRQFGRFVGLLDIGLHQGELVATGARAPRRPLWARRRSARASSNWSPGS